MENEIKNDSINITLIVITVVVVVISIAVIFMSSNVQSDKDISTLINDLGAGLEKRWVYVNNENVFGTLEALSKGIQAELDSLEPYSKKTLNDEELNKWSKEYVKSLKKQKEALQYLITNPEKYDILWEEGYQERIQLLQKINEKYSLKDAGIDQKELDQLLNTDKSNYVTVLKNIWNQSEMKKINVKDGVYAYVMNLENPTKRNIKSLKVSIKFKDSNGIIKETGYVDIDDLKAGEVFRLEIQSPDIFSEIKVIPVIYEY